MTKIAQSLQQVLITLRESNPNTLLNLVISPNEQKDVQALTQLIQDSGGRTTGVTPEILSCQIPVNQVECIVKSNLVANLRLARLHSVDQF